MFVVIIWRRQSCANLMTIKFAFLFNWATPFGGDWLDWQISRIAISKPWVWPADGNFVGERARCAMSEDWLLARASPVAHWQVSDSRYSEFSSRTLQHLKVVRHRLSENSIVHTVAAATKRAVFKRSVLFNRICCSPWVPHKLDTASIEITR